MRSRSSARAAAAYGQSVIAFAERNVGIVHQAAGAAGISVITTHGLFCGDALTRLKSSGLFEAIVCTDSHPRARELADGFLQVESVASLFAEHIGARD